MKRFYVYAYVVDGVVRYVGKGTGWRSRQHMGIARRINRIREAGGSVRASEFHNKLAKSIRDCRVIAVRILRGDLDEDAAYEAERQEIAARPAGELWNWWSGGVGGRVASAEMRAVLSQKSIERYSDPEQRARARELSAIISARPEVHAKRSEAQRRLWRENREAKLVKIASAHAPDVVKKRGLTYAKTVASRPELQELHAAASRSWWSRNKATQSQKLKDAWARPDVQRRRRAYLDSPEGRAKLRAASLARWAKHREANGARA